MANIWGTSSAPSSTRPVAPSTSGGGPGGILGFLTNLANDATSTVYGVGALASEGIHDLGHAAGSALDPILPGHGVSLGIIENTDKSGYHVPNIAEALLGTGPYKKAGSALVNDYQSRYGSLAGLKSGLYNHPLSYVLDALTVGDIAEKGAVLAGEAALADPAAAAAKTAQLAKTQDLLDAGMTFKNAQPSALRAGLDALAQQRPLSPLEDAARRLLPEPTAKLVGSQIIETAPKANPLSRLVGEGISKFTKEPVQDYINAADDLNSRMSVYINAGKEVPGKLQADYNQLQRVVSGAQDYNLTRIQRPFVAEKLDWLRNKSLLSNDAAAQLNAREGQLHLYQSAFKPFVKENPDIGVIAKGTTDGLHYDFHGPDLNQQSWFTPGRIAPHTAVSVDLGRSPVQTAVRAGLSDAERAAATDGEGRYLFPIAEQVDGEAQRVAQYISDLREGKVYGPPNTDVNTEIDAAQRYLDKRYGVVRHALADPRGQSDIVTRFNDTVSNLNARRELDMLGKGDTMEHIMARTYRSIQYKYGGVTDATTGEIAGAPEWRTFDDALRNAGLPAPNYYPYIPEQATHNFYEYLTNRVRIGGLKMARDPNRQYFSGDLLRSGDYISNPVEALTRRAIRYNRFESAKSFWTNVVMPGARKLEPGEDIASNEAIVAPEGMFRWWNQTIGLQDMVDHLTNAGVDQNGLADALDQFLFKGREDFVQRGITRQGMEVYAVSKTLARQMESYAHASGLFANPSVRMFWDTPTNLWRSLVLQYSPRWVLNNSLGNTVMQMFTGNGRLRDVLTIGEEKFRQAVADKLGMNFHSDVLAKLDQVAGMSEARTGGFAGVENLYNPKIGSAAEGENAGFVDSMRRVAGALPAGVKKAGNFNLQFNGVVEDTAREASYMDALAKTQLAAKVRPVARMFWSTNKMLDYLAGRRSVITDGEIASSLKELANTLGNYGALGPIERNVVRRFLFPFYGFYKHQAGLLARLPVETPLRANVIRMLGNLHNDMMQQYGPIPSWLQGSVPMGPPGSSPLSFFSSKGPNPFSASFQTIPSMLNPFAQIALERGLGRNLYTGQKYEGSPYDYYTGFGSDQAYQYQRDSNGNIVGLPIPVQGNVEPNLLDQILGTVPQYGSAKAVIAGAQPYDTTTLLGAIKARLSGTEARVADTSKPTSLLDQLLKVSGIGTTSYDLNSYQRNLLLGQLQALRASSSAPA